MASTLTPAAAKESKSRITKVVFVGKEHACDCTRKKVDTAFSALKQVLGEPPAIPIDILKADTEESKVEPYRKQRPIMALPAMYFIDSKGAVEQLLQGEITAEQISQALGHPASSGKGAS